MTTEHISAQVQRLLEAIERDTRTVGHDWGIPHIAELACEALTYIRTSPENRKRVFLVRDTMAISPDGGSSVKREEIIEAFIEWPEGARIRENDGYFEASGWRICEKVPGT